MSTHHTLLTMACRVGGMIICWWHGIGGGNLCRIWPRRNHVSTETEVVNVVDGSGKVAVFGIGMNSTNGGKGRMNWRSLGETIQRVTVSERM